MEYNNVSINIIRDEKKEINYIPTPNTEEIFNRIFSSRNQDNRSFSLIGNYGTGKSSFLWALEKTINEEAYYFSNTNLKHKNFRFLKLIGDNEFLSSSLKTALESPADASDTEVIIKLKDYRDLLAKDQTGLIILIDEFGKFLEKASKNNSWEELYLLQQIAELINDGEYNSYFIVTLHQSFVDYGNHLSVKDKLEWEKVKGRFLEVTFNEPVEQLIYFASKKLKEFTRPSNLDKRFGELNALIENSKLVNVNSNLNKKITSDLYPLDWLSAHILVNALQRYGQNERSLFSFLSDTSKFSITDFKKEFYSVADVYDYLSNTLSSVINGAANIHKAQWKIAFNALEKVELYYDDDIESYNAASEIVKTICLVNLFSKTWGKFDEAFIGDYFRLVRHTDVSHVIGRLKKLGVIRFYNHSNKINFLEGTDIDIDYELLSVQNEINHNFKISDEIAKRITLPVLLAKRVSFIKGTNRFFEFKIINDTKNIKPSTGALDGYVNLVFDGVSLDKLKKLSLHHRDNVFVFYKNDQQIRGEILNILKYERLLSKYQEDPNALKVLNSEREFHKKNLESLVSVNLFEKDLNTWVHNGEEISIESKKQLYEFLSQICEEVLYNKTPVFHNELINKEYLSTPINTARKALFRRLLDNIAEPYLGFEEGKYPPEKAIYVSLLKNTGIHKRNEEQGYYELSFPTEGSSLYELWNDSFEFLKSSSLSKRGLSEFYDMLRSKPYKLKSGFIDFWIPIFLIAHQDDLALFHEETGFVPYLNEDIIDILHKNATDFYIKYYEVSGVKLNILESYKELTQLDDVSFEGNKRAFLTIFANFLGFFKSLNGYTLKTKKLSSATIKFRTAVDEAKDPEDGLFNLFPVALGYHSLLIKQDIAVLESYVDQLKISIRELRQAYGDLLNRIEGYIIKGFFCNQPDFPKYKEEIIAKLNNIDINLLSIEQKLFYQRLVSPLDDRNSWIKSVADVAIEKSIAELLDEEELILERKIKDLSLGLIKAAEIHTYNQSANNEKLLAVRFFNASGQFKDHRFVTSGNKSEEYFQKLEDMERLISGLDKSKRSELLYELLNKELG